MDRPILGSWHTINGKARKVRSFQSHHHTKVEWVKSLRVPCKAMYIGYRKVFSGTTYVSSDESYFTRSKTYEVWLFVTSDRTNPIYVFPEQVEQS